MPAASPLQQICTRCRMKTLLHELRVARLPKLLYSSRSWASWPAQELRHAPGRGTPAKFQASQRLSRQSRHGFASSASPLLLQVGERRLRRRQRDNEEYPSELPQQQQLRVIEALYASGEITWEEWRSAVFAQIGIPGVSTATEERERDIENRIRTLRERYGIEAAVPEDLLNDGERKIWDRLFGSESLARLEELDPDQLDVEDLEETAQRAGTGVLREGRDGFEEVEFDEEEGESIQEQHMTGDRQLAEDIRYAMSATEDIQDQQAENEPGEDESRWKLHPLSVANRFGTSPSTIQLPQTNLVDPLSAVLAGISPVHIAETAHRVFGGPGLPYSTSTPHRGKLMQQKPIALDAYQSQMSPIEGDAYMAAIIPGIYASVIGVLTETRKRLGTAWAEGLVRKATDGNLKILDAGGGGAGVLAVREILRAEWARMHADDLEMPMDLVEADGRAGGAGFSPPLGTATVLTGSDTLRRRASQLLENTTFIPRLPDYIHTEEQKLHGKFDIVIAPHTLWPLKEDYIRKTHVQNLWSLLSSSGGVLILLEKGIARGFELVAGAREMLLDTRIASPGEEAEVQTLGKSEIVREPGMIVAPCTNHTSCPMYHQKGIVKGRRDICSFAQRYHRPPMLQKIYGTRGRNHEDVEFSYFSVMRGRDLRESNGDMPTEASQAVVQGHEATDRAFQGYETTWSPFIDIPDADGTAAAPPASSLSPPLPHSLSLPRAVFPPLKRKGHVILDVCTPAGTLERWTVPRSFSKQAFRDARKSSWGDLWAMGAKTRVPRSIKIGTSKADLDVEGFVMAGESRKGRKVKGIRDKRDKKGAGNGRKKYQDVA